MKKRKAASAKSRRRDELKAIGDDLERRWAELVNEQMRDWFLATAMGSTEGTAYLDKLGEVARQRLYNKMRLDALEDLPQSGRPAQDDLYDALALECLNATGRVMKNERELFIKRAAEERCIVTDSAENMWYKTIGRLFPKGAPPA